MQNYEGYTLLELDPIDPPCLWVLEKIPSNWSGYAPDLNNGDGDYIYEMGCTCEVDSQDTPGATQGYKANPLHPNTVEPEGPKEWTIFCQNCLDHFRMETGHNSTTYLYPLQ